MKATCPKCQTSYRVAADKVPEVGAQIRCPKCSTTFVVRRARDGAPGESPAAAPSHTQATPLSDLVGQGARPQAPARLQPAPAPQAATPDEKREARSNTPGLDALEGEAMVSTAPPLRVGASDKTRASARGVSAIRAQTGKASRALDGYRVRTARGLTYDFPSRSAMDRWLREREDLTGCEAAGPGGDWVEAGTILGQRPGTDESEDERKDAEKLDPSKPIDVSRIKPVVAILPGASVVEAEDAGPAEAAPYSGPRAGVLIWSTLVLFALLMAAGAALSLTRYGIVDFSVYLPFDLIGVEFPAADVQPDEDLRRMDDAPRLPVKEDPEERFRKALGAGRRALRGKRFSKAALDFKRALSVHPGSVKALEGLAKAFGGLGDRERAMNAIEKARAIKLR